MLAAAHAGCFTAALAFSLQAAGYTPNELSTEPVVTQEPEGASFRISCSALRLRAKVSNLTGGTFETMAWHAVNNCSEVRRPHHSVNAWVAGVVMTVSVTGLIGAVQICLELTVDEEP